MTPKVVKTSSFLKFSFHFYSSISFKVFFFFFNVVVTGLNWHFVRNSLDCWKRWQVRRK